MYLEKQTFKTVINSTPLVSIDLVAKNTKGEYLLGYRVNRPAQGFWFVPGGRILKNETMADAFSRLCKKELGLGLSLDQAHFIGPFEHLYDDYVFGEDVSTHYIALGYEIFVDINLNDLPEEQHEQYRWFSKDELLTNDNVHLHTKWYLNK